MKSNQKFSGFSLLLPAAVLIANSSIPAVAQPATKVEASRTVLTFVNRLIINPPQVVVFGYFPTIQGLPDPLFSGTPGEATAYLTWSLDAVGATQIPNGDAADPGSTSVAVLRSGEKLNIYFNANPNQNWANPASFSSGQLVATYVATTGTQTGSGPVALVTQTYVLDSSQDFTFKGQTYNFARLIPHGFTSIALSSNIPIGNSNPPKPPLVFTASGSGLAIGGAFSALPWWY